MIMITMLLSWSWCNDSSNHHDDHIMISRMITRPEQPLQRWCIWWSARERSLPAQLGICPLSDPDHQNVHHNYEDQSMTISHNVSNETWRTWRCESTETLTRVGMKCSSGAQVSENHNCASTLLSQIFEMRMTMMVIIGLVVGTLSCLEISLLAM